MNQFMRADFVAANNYPPQWFSWLQWSCSFIALCAVWWRDRERCWLHQL